MKPTKTLPENYSLYRRLNILDRKSLILVNVWGVVLFLASAVFFPLLAGWLSKTGTVGSNIEINGLAGIASLLGLLLVVMVVMIVLHEGLHGLVLLAFYPLQTQICLQGVLCLRCHAGLVPAQKGVPDHCPGAAGGHHRVERARVGAAAGLG